MIAAPGGLDVAFEISELTRLRRPVNRWETQDFEDADRRSWLVIRPTAITGRRLRATEVQWAFSLRGYL
jgi:hypothetical protein